MILASCLVEVTIVLKSTLVLMPTILHAAADPGEDHHHCF
jgi:hypothetical protein